MTHIINGDMIRLRSGATLHDDWISPVMEPDRPGPKCPKCGANPFKVDMPAGDYSVNMRCACGFDGIVHFTMPAQPIEATDDKGE